MHELALTEGVIRIVESEADKQGFTRTLEIRLRVGEYSGVIPECLREVFPIASRGTRAEGAKLVTEPVPAAFRCLSCGYEGPAGPDRSRCASCGSTAIRMTAGRDFYVESLAVE